MAVFLSPAFNDTQFKSDGTLAVGYKIYSYAEGSSTPLSTYTDSTGATPQANPIILNARGECSSPIWLTGGLGYKLVLTTNADVPLRTIDNVRGIGDTTISVDQWVASGLTPTYISATSFSLVGDQTSAFHVGRKVKSTTSGGTIYSTISASAFTTLTTVTVINDSGVLDTGLSAVSYALLTNVNDSLPAIIDTNVQKQTCTAFTTAGSSSVFTLTPTPALAALTTNARFNITFDEAPTGSPTIAVSGLTAKSLKYYDSAGAKQFIAASVVPINWNTDIIYDGTDWMVQNYIVPIRDLVANSVLISGTGSNLISGAGIFGYTTGSGGDVTQATNKSTAVTLDKSNGRITMNAAALAANTTVSFTLNNSLLLASDLMVLNHKGGGTVGNYNTWVQTNTGLAVIYVRNITAGSLSDALILQFAVIRGVIA